MRHVRLDVAVSIVLNVTSKEGSNWTKRPLHVLFEMHIKPHLENHTL